MSRHRKIAERFVKEQNGLLGNVYGDVENSDIVTASQSILSAFHTGQVIVFLNPLSGLRTGGPVSVLTYDAYQSRLVVSSGVAVNEGDAIYLHDSQDEHSPPKV